MVKVSKPKTAKNESEYEHTFIRHVKVGQTFGGVYYLVSSYEKTAINGKIYSDLTVRDKSGECFVRYWGETKNLNCGDFILVLATVEEYRGNPQIVASEVDKTSEPCKEDMDRYFISVSETLEKDIEKFEKYVSRVKSICEDIEDNTCIDLIEGVFGDAKSFFEAPSSDKNFYGIRGGLLSQTVKVVFMCGNMASQYNLSKKETAILITSALLFRVGAVDVYTMNGCNSEMKTQGKLLGCIFFTLGRIQTAFSQDFNVDTVNRVVHAVVSQDSSTKQMTKEAIILSQAVRSDMRIVESIDYIDQDINDEKFTAFDPISKQQYFKG
jgi:23S rRNA maturation-related 3'-5' exoribonuclease YhaM